MSMFIAFLSSRLKNKHICKIDAGCNDTMCSIFIKRHPKLIFTIQKGVGVVNIDITPQNKLFLSIGKPEEVLIAVKVASRPGRRVEKRPGEYCLRAQQFLLS